MTSGPIKIPPSQIPGQPAPAQPSKPNVLITSLPEAWSDNKKTIEIKGQVIRTERDGTLQIRTEKGDIEVKSDLRQLNVRTGDNVEIEIPPGRPPETARVTREAQRTEIPVPPRGSQTPVNVEVRPERPPEIPVPLPATLSEGQVVRLEPISRQQVEQYAAIPFETVVTQTPEVIATQAEIIVQNAQADIINQLTGAALPPGTPQPIVSAPIAPQTTATPTAQPSVLLEILTQAEAFLAAPTNVPITGGLPQAIFTPQIGPDTVQIQNFATQSIQQAIQLTPFRAEVAALNPGISPAIVTPKIPPSPVISPETLLKATDKPLILQNQKAGEIPAVVVGMTPQSLPIIAMTSPLTGEEMFFIMHIPAGTVVPGTELTLIPQQPLAAPSTAPIMATVMMPQPPVWFLTPEPWPLMDEIQASLAQIAPQAAQAMLHMTPTPQNPAQLGSAVLFFVAAVRGGDLSQWLGGGAVDALKRGGKSGLLNRLTQESNSLNRLSSEPVSGDWRAVTVPMAWDNNIYKMALYYKNDSQQERADKEGRQLRFVFDLSLDVMGKVQLDGLFRAKRLDLIVRTKTPLSRPMQEDMRRLYAGALGTTSVTGELSFQNNVAQWVTITPKSDNFVAST